VGRPNERWKNIERDGDRRGKDNRRGRRKMRVAWAFEEEEGK